MSEPLVEVKTTVIDRARWMTRDFKHAVKNYLVTKALKLVVHLERDSNYLSHTRREVPEWFNDEGPDKWIADGTIELLAVLSHQGHSGGSIGFALNFFETMARLKPWGPLTGAEDEWTEPYNNDGTQQNVRCSSVFRNADGSTYNIDGKYFHDGDGHTYSNRESRVPVEFPYTIPKPIIIDLSK